MFTERSFMDLFTHRRPEPEFTHCVCCVACLTTQRSDMVDPLSRWNSDPPTIAARGVNTSSENGREKRPALMATCKSKEREGSKEGRAKSVSQPFKTGTAQKLVIGVENADVPPHAFCIRSSAPSKRVGWLTNFDVGKKSWLLKRIRDSPAAGKCRIMNSDTAVTLKVLCQRAIAYHVEFSETYSEYI